MRVLMDDLSGSALEIAEVLGVKTALYLIGRLPSTPSHPSKKIMYVPKLDRLHPSHKLVQILGWHDAKRLSKAFGGEIIQPSNCSYVYKKFRDQRIYQMVDMGQPISQVANAMGMEVRACRYAYQRQRDKVA